MQADEVVIIGAGPAGITAAIQLKRYGIPFILLERDRVGGLLWNANLVENFPGFPVGVSGPELIGLMEKQMERVGVEVTFDPIERLSCKNEEFKVATSQTEYCPRYVIVASGTRAKPFPIRVPKGIQKMVFSDVYHLLDVHEKRIVIIGGGDAAFDYAINLVKRGNFVTILNRSGDVKCLKLLWDRAQAEELIDYRADTPVSAVEFDEMESTHSGTGRLEARFETGGSISVDYLLFAIGRVPQTEFLSKDIIKKKVDNLIFIGDVKNGIYRQAAIAAGDGLRAAMQIYHSLSMKDRSI